MATDEADKGSGSWRERLGLPAYRVSEAARYAGVSPQVVSNWMYRSSGLAHPILQGHERSAALSYLELVEVAVVAIFRKLGVPLRRLRLARTYMQQVFNSDHPFAEYGFRTDGLHVFLDWNKSEENSDLSKIIVTDSGGQMGWQQLMLERLSEFDYEFELALVWHLAGRESAVQIDPRISFGVPSIRGVPTWAIRDRWNAGESIDEIVEDLGINNNQVSDALRFEGVCTAA